MATVAPQPPQLDQLRDDLGNTAFAFRGYNVTNLERTPELLAVKAYADVMQRRLQEASEVCSDIKHRRVDLLTRVKEHRDTDLNSYDEAIAMIV
ncbi:MAG: hypothetical protein AAGF97_15745, partial [Planctomycetota bacterium]